MSKPDSAIMKSNKKPHSRRANVQGALHRLGDAALKNDSTKLDSRVIDLAGQEFGTLTVISYSGREYWLVECICGTKKTVRGSHLKSGATASCGCYRKTRMSNRLIDHTGQRFGRLAVICLYDRRGTSIRFKCICDCGKEAIVRSGGLRNGKTRSCGCIKKETNRDRLKKESISRKGEQHHNWNPNLSQEDREEGRNSYRRLPWLTQIFKRDNFTCQICGQRGGGTLHAHHLDGYHWCVERRWNVANGVTLCKRHHREFHKLFGIRNNTSKQFKAYKAGELTLFGEVIA